MPADEPARRSAIRFIVLLGFLSLLADVTYEGARGITGPYLRILGASAAAVGTVAGAGELAGYGLRLIFGYLTERTRKYWSVLFAGYAVNLLAVPLLAAATGWETAAALILAERLGKAIRAPARDAVLSGAARVVGSGWGFGLHEAMDQIGALTGPLIVALVLALSSSYRASFAVLLVPALAALGVLGLARFSYPRPQVLEEKHAPPTAGPLPRVFWWYLAATGLMAAGFADFPLIAFHLKRSAIARDAWIPLLYALAMGVDGMAALVFGKLFDRWGRMVVGAASVFAAAAVPLCFGAGLGMAVGGVALWGMGMGVQESVLRAAVADMVPAGRRASAYGIFNSAFGVCWFLGSALMGMLYDLSMGALVGFAAGAQVAALAILLAMRRLG